MPTPGSAPPVLIIGLDGATFQLLDPWIESGELPCLARLCREGARGVLQSVTPPLSPEAWSTFMTGKHPGLHGVMNFLCFRPGTYEIQFSNGALLRQKTLWRMLSDAGMRVGIMGVPMTYPPEPVNGYLVSGIETPGERSKFTYPESLAQELREALGGYDLHGDFADSTDPQEYLSRLLATIDNQADAACYLLERHPADLSVFTIGATDRVQHSFWGQTDALKKAYQRVDGAVARIIECLPEPRNLIIMSDHGFGSCHTIVNLNRWLEQRGYLTYEGRTGGLSALHRAYQLAGRLAPRSLKDVVKSRLPGFRRRMASSILFGYVSWPHTRAFAVSTQHGYVHLNRRDRFPRGTVEPGAEADQLCDSISSELAELRHPTTGEPMVERVVRTRDEYPGPACDELPDLVVLWREGFISRVRTDSSGRHGESDQLTAPTGRSIDEWRGSHRPDGMLIAHGPDFVSGVTADQSHLADLAPTVLHLLGQPVPDDMTGRVLQHILDGRFLARRPVQYARTAAGDAEAAADSALTAEECQEVAERLRRMGYL